MKKSSNLAKVTACLVACFVLVIGNPIKAEAGYWSCYFGFHNYEKHYIPGDCRHYGYTELICADCGHSDGKVATDFPRHCFTTDPYQVPTCIYCGYKKR